MGISVFPAASAASKTRYVVTLLSGTSWTVPAGCLYVNAELIGGGAGSFSGGAGGDGQKISSSFATIPGASVAYAIGAGGAQNVSGGNTTMTGATTASGGSSAGVSTPGNEHNGGIPSVAAGADHSGAQGKIDIEYWV